MFEKNKLRVIIFSVIAITVISSAAANSTSSKKDPSSKPNIISNHVDGNTGFRGIRTDEYTLAYQRKGKKLQGFLFDLKNDPYEMNSLFNKDDNRVIELKKDLVKWLKKTNDPFVLE